MAGLSKSGSGQAGWRADRCGERLGFHPEVLDGQAAEFRVLGVQERNFREEMVAFMEEVQAGKNTTESPTEEVTGLVETEQMEAAAEQQADSVEVAAPDEEQSDHGEREATPAGEAEEDEVSPEEQPGDEGAEPGIVVQAGTVNGEIPTEDEEDLSEMGGIPVEDWDYQRPRRGEVRTGIILSIGEQEIIIDVGAKRDGIVPYADMQRMGEEALAELRVGSEVPVYVLRPEDQEGNLLISLYMARQQKAWIRAQKLADSGEIWEEEVIGYNKGGLVVPLDEIRGFVPASQVPGFPHGLSQEERLARLAAMVGETLPVKVIEINRRKRRLILSSTAAQQDWRKQARERLLGDLREGEVRTGTVSSLCSFGAFVDLGGADGLVHISELSWRRIRHPREVVSVGEEVEVYVLRLDHERQRIGLSLKRLQPEPWSLVEDKYELGQLIEGVVTNVVDFGAFAEVEEGVEGLIHVSELAEAPISHPRDVVKKGDLLLLRVIRIDTRRKRLGLSLKRVLESEWSEWAARLAAAEREKEAAEAEAEEAEEAVEAEEPVAAVAEEVGEEVAEAETAEEAVEVEEPVAEAAEEIVGQVAETEVAEEAVEAEEPVAAVAEEVGQEVAEAETTEEAAEAEEPVAEAAEEIVGQVAEAETAEEVAEVAEEPVAEVTEEAAEATEELEMEVAEVAVEAVEEPVAVVAEEVVEQVAEAETAEEVVEAAEEPVAEIVEEAMEATEELEMEVAEEAVEAAEEPVAEIVEEAAEATEELEVEAAEEAVEVTEEAVAEVVEEAAEAAEGLEAEVAEEAEAVEQPPAGEGETEQDPQPAVVRS
jgi:small subunit ribosomal protein S1